MSLGHARFESLEGAILLGEASPEDRAEFALHARSCSLCDEAASEAALLAVVEPARDTENWRPSVERSVVGRIRDERNVRSRLAVGALGWAAACSIAINVAFVTGLAGKLGSALNFETPPASVAAAPYVVHLPPQTFASVKRREFRPAASVLALRRPPRHRAAAHAGALPEVARALRPATGAAEPDIFAGLDVRGTSAARSVAVQTPPCEGPCATWSSERRP